MSTLSKSTLDKPTLGRSSDSDQSTLQSASELLGRVLLSALFLLSGIGKIGAYAATAGYMASVGVPGALLPLVILTEDPRRFGPDGGLLRVDQRAVPRQLRRPNSDDHVPQELLYRGCVPATGGQWRWPI